LEISKTKLIFIIIGSAISGIVLFLLVLSAIFCFTTLGIKKDLTLLEPPPISQKAATEQYLGTPQILSGKFDRMSHDNLSEGPGTIAGKALVDGKPCSGLKLKLALNGKVWSQWAVTNTLGEYKIKVPYGKYRIDGWNLDEQSSDKVLPGKIHHPAGIFAMFESFSVDEKKNGKGPILYFVNPVKIIQPIGETVLSDDLILEWEPYPNAAFYRIQIRDHGEGWNLFGERIFKTSSDEPIVRDTKVTFKKIGADLIKAHYYAVTIWALNKDMYQLSKSIDSRRFGFFISK
jgi:hypothetical protein